MTWMSIASTSRRSSECANAWGNGLNMLAKLTKLEELDIYSLDMLIVRVKELKWIVDQWPKLSRLPIPIEGVRVAQGELPESPSEVNHLLIFEEE